MGKLAMETVNRLIWGLFLIAIGGMLLAVNLGVELPHGVWNYWPFLVIAVLMSVVLWLFVRTGAHPPDKLPAHAAPQALQVAGVVAGWINIGHWPGFFTTGRRVVAGKSQPCRVAKISLEPSAVITTGGIFDGCQRYAGGHLHTPQGRVVTDAGDTGDQIRHKSH